MKKRNKIIIVPLVLTLSACASLQPKTGFDEVAKQVSERVGKKIHWRQGGKEDEAVTNEVRKMLQGYLTADEAVQVALLNNPKLQAIYEEIGVAQADVVQAGLLRNPVFEGAILRPRREDGKVYDFDISWDFLGVFTLPLRKAAAERDYEATKLRVTNEVMAMASEVRGAFYQAQANQQFVEMMQQVMDATDSALFTSKRLRAAGNITELALVQRKALHQESRLALASAEAALMESKEKLNMLMGVWGTATRWNMATRLPDAETVPMNLDAIEERAIERNLVLTMMRLQIEAMAKRVGVTNVTSIIDDLEIGYRWERNEKREWEDGPSISFPIPIFDFGQAKRAKARAQLQQAFSKYKDLAIKIRSSARGSARGLEMARMRERHLREVMLPLRASIIDGLMLEYNAMQIGVFRLLRAQEQQLFTGQRYIESLRDYWLARGRVEQLVNGRMSEGGGMAAAMPASSGSGSEGGH